MCGCALSVMLLTLVVVLPTPHDYSGTFQRGHSARFITLRGLLKESLFVIIVSTCTVGLQLDASG